MFFCMYKCEVSMRKAREPGAWFIPLWLEVCCLQKEIMPLSLPTYPDWAQLSQDTLNLENILSFTPSINILNIYCWVRLSPLFSVATVMTLLWEHSWEDPLPMSPPQPSSDQPLRGSHICLLKCVFFLVIPFYQAFLGFLAYGTKSALQQGV